MVLAHSGWTEYSELPEPLVQLEVALVRWAQRELPEPQVESEPRVLRELLEVALEQQVLQEHWGPPEPTVLRGRRAQRVRSARLGQQQAGSGRRR